jgi:G3E family GTPase
MTSPLPVRVRSRFLGAGKTTRLAPRDNLRVDRRQEGVLIGVRLDEATLRPAFDACMLTRAEIAEQHAWAMMPHPFPWPGSSV